MPTSVLVVDDDAAFRALAVRFLTRLGFAVVAEAGTVVEATTVAGHVRPDAALVDVGLPDGSGIELAGRLAALPWRPRVVLTSTDPDVTTSDDARSAGAIGFIPKAQLPEGAVAGLLRGSDAEDR
jgi:DNA-binding NarL/FixJ family response regulator